jgi:OPA family glycerol-3-phosphate transporter-like MFS transporter
MPSKDGQEIVDPLDIPEESEPFFTMRQRKIYNKWRLRILIFVIIGYATYYLCRQNFSMIMPSFIEEFGYSNTQIGWVFSIGSIVYGVGKFMNGYFSDLSNPRYFMPIGLVCSAIVTFCLGFSDSLMFLGVSWIINNWFQSMGWPPAAKMLTHWFAQKELGTKWAFGAASHQVGGGLTLIFAGYLIANFGWRVAFFAPAIIAMLVAAILVNRLRQSPEELGFLTVEVYKGDAKALQKQNDENFSTKEIINKVFLNKKIWLLCMANMCLYVVRLGIIFWAPLFLQEFKNISLAHAGWQVACYEIIGLAGGFAAGSMSDKIFKGERGPVGALFMLGLAIALWGFWQIPVGSNLLSAFFLTAIGFFVYGPQVLVGVASADFASKKAVGTANGLTGTMGYLGSAISGVCVGLISDQLGWDAVFIFFIISALLGSLFFLITWDKFTYRRFHLD